MKHWTISQKLEFVGRVWLEIFSWGYHVLNPLSGFNYKLRFLHIYYDQNPVAAPVQPPMKPSTGNRLPVDVDVDGFNS